MYIFAYGPCSYRYSRIHHVTDREYELPCLFYVYLFIRLKNDVDGASIGFYYRLIQDNSNLALFSCWYRLPGELRLRHPLETRGATEKCALKLDARQCG